MAYLTAQALWNGIDDIATRHLTQSNCYPNRLMYIYANSRLHFFFEAQNMQDDTLRFQGLLLWTFSFSFHLRKTFLYGATQNRCLWSIRGYTKRAVALLWKGNKNFGINMGSSSWRLITMILLLQNHENLHLYWSALVYSNSQCGGNFNLCLSAAKFEFSLLSGISPCHWRYMSRIGDISLLYLKAAKRDFPVYQHKCNLFLICFFFSILL